MNVKEIVLSVLAICTIVILPHTELIPGFAYSIPILLMVWLVLKSSKETFSNIGFSFKRFELKSVPVGILAAVLTVAFMQLIFFPVLESFVSWEYNDQGLNDTIRENKWQYLLLVLLGWLIGGFYEEIVFHGFIFTRLEKMIQVRYATFISFAITAILFGVYHFQLGALGLINALLVGSVYLALFLYFKRNLWYSIICHGIYNTIVMTLIYYDYL